jgi:hydroxylamine reductase
MFCFHCQEVKKNTVCDDIGICGKTDDVSNLQDLLVFALKGLSFYAAKAGELGIIDADADIFAARALYATVTNVDFDAGDFTRFIKEAVARRNRLRDRFNDAYRQRHGKAFAEPLPENASWQYVDGGVEEFAAKSLLVGLAADTGTDKDVLAVRELLTYGLKGLSAYIDRAHSLGFSQPQLFAFLHRGLAFTLNQTASVDAYLPLALECGQHGLKALELIDDANTERFGQPVPTTVRIGTWERPGILVSGYDLLDLQELLEQSAGAGIDVYTHGEMLAAHAYPELSKFPHLLGHYGGGWWEQRSEFEAFNGPILATSDSVQQPKKKYIERFFTTGLARWTGIPHIPDRLPGKSKNFSILIELAKRCPPPTAQEEHRIAVGFAQQALFKHSGELLHALKTGAIKHLAVLAGSDGRQKERKYYTGIAEALPADCIILAAGCAKFRYNRLDMGNIGGLPRVLDAGQINDTHALLSLLQKLAEGMGVEHINRLPVSFNIAWYEQKSLLLILSLLSLGIERIRLGPTLPAFLSENIRKLLAERYGLKPIGEVARDVEGILAGNRL